MDSMQLMCHETPATCPFARAVVQAIYVPIDATKAVSWFVSCSVKPAHLSAAAAAGSSSGDTGGKQALPGDGRWERERQSSRRLGAAASSVFPLLSPLHSMPAIPAWGEAETAETARPGWWLRQGRGPVGEWQAGDLHLHARDPKALPIGEIWGVALGAITRAEQPAREATEAKCPTAVKSMTGIRVALPRDLSPAN